MVALYSYAHATKYIQMSLSDATQGTMSLLYTETFSGPALTQQGGISWGGGGDGSSGGGVTMIEGAILNAATTPAVNADLQANTVGFYGQP
jgi:hypothetical protein